MERCGGYEKQIYGSDAVVCPKPRRICLLNPAVGEQIRSPRRSQMEVSDSRARAELFDFILAKGDKSTNQVAYSPPFFTGSPPIRVSNPLIKDSRFVCNGVTPLSPAAALAISPSSSGRRGGSCAQEKYGIKPVAVRIEGFNCLSGDCRSISVVH